MVIQSGLGNAAGTAYFIYRYIIVAFFGKKIAGGVYYDGVNIFVCHDSSFRYKSAFMSIIV